MPLSRPMPPRRFARRFRPLPRALQRISPRGLLLALTALYVFVLCLVAGANAAGPERWWLSTVNLYLPQWFWGIPAVALCAATWVVVRRWAALQLLPLIYVAGPLMGFCWSWSAPAASARGDVRLRVMTYNIEWGNRDLAAIAREIDRARPDLLILQEVRGDVRKKGLDEILSLLDSRWEVRNAGEYLVASRLPILSMEWRPLPAVLDTPDKAPNYLRCRVRIGSTAAVVYGVHFLTPRHGLNALRRGSVDASARIAANARARLGQGALVLFQARREREPVIVAGDFNAPMPALSCRQFTDAGFRDAFTVAGRGYGYTYGHVQLGGLSFVRIDHVFVSPHWRVRACTVGGSDGADHRPVVTDLILPLKP